MKITGADARQYWEERLAQDFSLGSVGDKRLGLAYNRWLYRARRRALDRAIKSLGIGLRGRRALDLGSGTGFYVGYWLEKGASDLTGVDITELSVRNLAARFPNSRFLRASVGDPEVGELGRFDLISAFDVMFHIVDEDVFVRTWENIGRCAEDGAYVLISDAMTENDAPASSQEYHRSHDHYRRAAQAVGLEVVYLAPIFYSMLSPVDFSEANVAVRSTWWLTLKALKISQRLRLNTFVGNALGLPLYTLDGLLLRAIRSSPTTKLMVLRKAAG